MLKGIKNLNNGQIYYPSFAILLGKFLKQSELPGDHFSIFPDFQIAEVGDRDT